MEKGREIVEEILTKRKSVIDIIKEMKELALLGIDLAFAALITQDKKLAKKVQTVEEDLNKLQYELEVETMLVPSTPQEAMEIVGITRIASAMEEISNATHELIDSVLRDIPINRELIEVLKEEMVTKVVEAKDNKKHVGKTIKEINEQGLKVLALKRKDEWRYLPEADIKIEVDDTLILRKLYK